MIKGYRLSDANMYICTWFGRVCGQADQNIEDETLFVYT